MYERCASTEDMRTYKRYAHIQDHWPPPFCLLQGLIIVLFNDNCLALVQQATRPSAFNNFGSLILCNFIYKLISKVIANRLKPLLPLFLHSGQLFTLSHLLSLKRYLLKEQLHLSSSVSRKHLHKSTLSRSSSPVPRKLINFAVKQLAEDSDRGGRCPMEDS